MRQSPHVRTHSWKSRSSASRVWRTWTKFRELVGQIQAGSPPERLAQEKKTAERTEVASPTVPATDASVAPTALPGEATPTSVPPASRFDAPTPTRSTSESPMASLPREPSSPPAPSGPVANQASIARRHAASRARKIPTRRSTKRLTAATSTTRRSGLRSTIRRGAARLPRFRP